MDEPGARHGPVPTAPPLMPGMRIREALQAARSMGLDRNDARRLMAHVTGRGSAWLLAHDDEPLAPFEATRFLDAAAQRAQGRPLAYLTGERAFHQLVLQVDERVLDPRPDTETLVDWALQCLQRPGAPAAPWVLDLGTGSGAVALALARACPQARVVAVDRSADALQVARANGDRLGLPVLWLQGDWFDDWRTAAQDGQATTGDGKPGQAPTPWPRRFDLIVSNPPYIAEGDPHLPALRHEPRTALVSGVDGLDDLRRIIAGASHHLAAEGALLVEHGHAQGSQVQALMEQAGGRPFSPRHDLAGHWRCTGAGWMGPEPAANAPAATGV